MFGRREEAKPTFIYARFSFSLMRLCGIAKVWDDDVELLQPVFHRPVLYVCTLSGMFSWCHQALSCFSQSCRI